MAAPPSATSWCRAGLRVAARWLLCLSWGVLAFPVGCGTSGDEPGREAVAAEPGRRAGGQVPGARAAPGVTTSATDSAPGLTATAASSPGSLGALTEQAGWRSSDGYHGLYSLAWRPSTTAHRLLRNAEFSMDVVLHDEGAPVLDAKLHVTADMPAHGHGMVQLPQIEALGNGRFRIDGMLLHMRGSWQLRFAVVIDRQAETFFFDIEV